MNVIVFHENKSCVRNRNESLLRFALSEEPISSVILDGLGKSLRLQGNHISMRFSDTMPFDKAVFAVPQDWAILKDLHRSQEKSSRLFSFVSTNNIIPYAQDIPIGSVLLYGTKGKTTVKQWLVVSNGRFATQINPELLRKVITEVRADVISVDVKPDLLGDREKVCLTDQRKVVGFRRLYSDFAELTRFPTDWPCHLFIKLNIIDKLLSDSSLPKIFDALIQKCRSSGLSLRAVNLGGSIFDLENEDGLLDFCRMRLNQTVYGLKQIEEPDAKFSGTVLLGKNVHIDPEVVVIGPSIVCSDVRLAQGAVINSSIIGSRLCVLQNQFVDNCIVKDTQCKSLYAPATTLGIDIDGVSHGKRTHDMQQDIIEHNVRSGKHLPFSENIDRTYRYWPRFSYARCFKRIADCVASVLAIILFAPFFPFIALAIKLTSPGAVFFRDRRQGLHGRPFYCLKFRTMVTGASKIQEKLRSVSQVDGPQFKMDDDPRLNFVGRFLRETYIDEIPQFLNVLLGQMSVVGPRPSPESENTLCPFWRDARLSVKPGITGLWQISRTRQPMKDFQEWIRYDTEYVRNLSLKVDLRICWRTFKKLVDEFINQF